MSRLWFSADSGVGYQSHLTFAGAPERGAPRLLVEDAPMGAMALRLGGEAPAGDVEVGWVITEDSRVFKANRPQDF